MFKQWQLKDFDTDGGLAEAAHRGAGDDGWIDVEVPGDTYVALAKAGRITHPFRGRSENELGWIAQRQWWWRTQFSIASAADDERMELVFEGLDTFAAVYLNGSLLGRTDNMFRQWRFDIRALLRADAENELAIAFSPPSTVLAGRETPPWMFDAERFAASKRSLMRKAQFGWGWDWGPCLPTVGVWQPVRIERWRKARITDLHFSTRSIAGDAAQLLVQGEFELSGHAGALTAEISLLDPKGTLLLKQELPAKSSIGHELELRNPELWWTADLGNQPLYTVALRLLDGGTLLDSRQLRVGIRTVALDTSPDADEPGTRFFRFVLNGVPIFARGVNWIPATSFVGEKEQQQDKLLIAAAQANMNMIRVWGGGVYEPRSFHDLCDRLGLLVWQDFMFACAPYPADDPSFAENVRHEVEHQVRRLRNHPSLALWCGNNECQMMEEGFNIMARTDTPVAGAAFYNDIMPAAVSRLDPATPYWPGSPYGGGFPNSMREGDVHHWTVWHGLPLIDDKVVSISLDPSPEGVAYSRYAEDTGRFISEFGIQSAPAYASLRRWMNPEDLKLGSEGFLERIKDAPKDKIHAMLIPETGLPETLEDYVAFTMLTQAEGLKFGIEHFRRRKPHCSGTLIWQYNDCWPCVSWSLVDYDGVCKASYFATARAYAPLIATFKRLGTEAVQLWITNDTLSAVSGELILELLGFGGEVDWRLPLQFQVPANASIPVWQGQAPARAQDRVICVHSPENQFPPNRNLFAAVKDLNLVPGVPPEMTIRSIDEHEMHVTLSARVYLLFVHLAAEDPDIRYSDNYFDMRPGEDRLIVVRNAKRPLSRDSVALHYWK